MAKPFVICIVAFLCAVSFAQAGQNSETDTTLGQAEAKGERSWTGVLISSACTLGDAFNEAEKCTMADPASKLVLYDDNIRQLYSLDPPDQGALHIGDSVTVRGILDENTIHVASIEPLTTFGLKVGEKAPDFSLHDQFGKEQTLATLKGSKGTVMLFFRSADWCPYCKGQLIQLENAKARFEEQGLKLAGISYDNAGILKAFADRRMIDFPLLSDADSRVIDRHRREWQLQVQPLDRQRAPEGMRHQLGALPT